MQFLFAGFLVAGGKIPCGACFREGKGKIPAHADILAALAWHEKGKLAGAGMCQRNAGALGKRRIFCLPGAEQPGEFACLVGIVLAVCRNDRGTAFRHRVEGTVSFRGYDCEIILGLKPGGGGLEILFERFCAFSREHEEFATQSAFRLRCEFADIFFQRDVEIGPAETERADSGTARMILAPDPRA